ncbi:YcxB family protein [Porcipelethomonas sp.]|uniref:YcxB family protein n=1 Tax=Porcipelethomonas sp. TaxID=2981675 RepID=UPI003EF1D30E
MDEEILVKKRYSIPYEMFGEAFTVFQKKFVYPRNMIMSVILLIAAILNVVNIVLGEGSTIGYVLIFVCLALIGVNWYNPKKLKRNLMESIKGIENDVYVMTLYPDKMLIGTVLEPEEQEEKTPEEYEEVFGDMPEKEEIAETEIYLNNSVKVVERKDFFIVYIKKSMFYVIPKKDFTEEEITLMNLHFGNQLYKNFICEVNK